MEGKGARVETSPAAPVPGPAYAGLAEGEVGTGAQEERDRPRTGWAGVSSRRP